MGCVSLSPVTQPSNLTHPYYIPSWVLHMCPYPRGIAFIRHKYSMYIISFIPSKQLATKDQSGNILHIKLPVPGITVNPLKIIWQLYFLQTNNFKENYNSFIL